MSDIICNHCGHYQRNASVTKCEDCNRELPQAKGSESWHVYQLNDCDWWLARSMAEAKENAAQYYGCEPTDDEMFQDDAHQLSEADLDRLRFLTTDSRKGPSVSFRQELQRRITEGPKVEMFASTEC